MNRQASEYEREEIKREGNGETRRKQNVEPAKVIRAEMEEDLKGLQNTYNQIVSTLQSRGEISDAFAKESALAIKKYAARLKENLSLPAPDDKEKPSVETMPDGKRKSLSALCKHIYEFMTNPIFETTTGLNVEHSAKARQSLDTIILFAEKIAGAE